jgi:hypothetical protein
MNDIIEKLWAYGHFNNPGCPTGVCAGDRAKLTLDDAAVRTAVASYQSFMGADFDRLSARYHGRPGVADGLVGPATMDLLDLPRCGCPDFLAAAVGSGSWPAGCHPDWPNNHAFTVNVNKSGMPAYLADVVEDAWGLCRASYADIGIVFIREDGNTRANTTVTWTRGAGWIGLAIVPSGPRCGDTIWAKFDNQYRPSALLDQWARLLAHEFGHNMGMGHSRGGIMNPSIVTGPYTRTAWRGDPSEALLTRYFGGVPVDVSPDPPTPDPDDPDPPSPPVGRLTFRGEFEAYDEAGTYHGTYHLRPIPPPEF